MTVELSKPSIVCEFQPLEPRDFGGPADGPPAKSALEQPKATLPEPKSALVTEVPKGPPKAPLERPKATVEILEDGVFARSSSEIQDQQESSRLQALVAPSGLSSGSCIALTTDGETAPELDHPANPEVKLEKELVEPEEEHPEEVRARAKPEERPEVPRELNECASAPSASAASVLRVFSVELERGAVAEKWGFQWDREAMDRQKQRVISAVGSLGAFRCREQS
eukprot:g5206.t1